MRTNVLSSLLATSLLFWSAPAAAVGNLSPSSMNDWNGRAYNKTAAIQQGYDIVVKQLGMAIANHPHSVTSMGLHGFEMSVQNTVSFIDAARYADGSPSPWNLAFSNEEAPENLWIPAIHIKKGLPLSLEIGGRTGMIQGDTGSIFGTYVRCSPVEGYAKAPDITIQSGYTGYIGNADLAVGTMDLSMTIGKAIPFGPLTGVNSSIIKPFVAGGLYWLRSDPRLQPEEQASLGIGPVSAFKKSDFYTDGYRLFAIDGGVEIESNEIVFALSGSYSPGNLFTIEHQFGFAF
jgi:hypothetical protein